MDSDHIEDGLEDFLKERADQFRMHPSESVWTELTGKLRKPRKWPYALGGIFLFGLGLGAGVLLEHKTDIMPARGQRADVIASPLTYDRAIADGSSQTVGSMSAQDDAHNTVASFLLEHQHQERPDRLKNHTPAEETAAYARVSPYEPTLGSPPLFPLESNLMPGVFTPQSSGLLGRVVNLERRAANKTNKERALKNFTKPSVTANLLNTLGRIGKRTGLQLYVAPSVSYRKLVGQATKSTFTYSGFPYSANFGFPTDVNDAVHHRPAFGIEIGSALTHIIGRNIRLKAGLQLNYNNYDVEAYSYMPELAPFSAARQQGYGGAINTLAYYRSANGFNRTWLRNSHVMIAMPVGIDASLFGNRRVRFNVASTIQPTYVLNNKSYLISTNLKNYAQEPSLYRTWNLNAGAEAYVSVDAGSFRWVIGPQVRYQLLSSYKEDYPIREHLIDYGFKVGIQKTLR